MHENHISKEVIGAAIDVHRALGPGLLEGIYEEALCYELHLRGLAFLRQQRVPLIYKGVKLATDLRLDLLVESKVVVELKAKETLSTTDRPQLLSYLRLCNLHLELLINFNVTVLHEGVHRVVNQLPPPRDDSPPSF